MNENGTCQMRPQAGINIFLQSFSVKNPSTIPHSTLRSTPKSYDDTRPLWDVDNEQRKSSIIAHDKFAQSTTIEGASSTGDTGIGGGNCLHLTITAQKPNSEQINDFNINRGGGGGGASVSCDSQTPPTPSVGKTLFNTCANLLPITTASDTFNNLKNLVKIDKVVSPTHNNGVSGNSYRGKGTSSNYKSNTGSGGITSSQFGGKSSPTFGSSDIGGGVSGAPLGKHNNSNNNSSNGGRYNQNGSSNFSTGFNKNSVKIRQHDSEVNQRPRRTYQGESSSSRYYHKNSDIYNQGQISGAGPENSHANANISNGNNSGGGRYIIGSDSTARGSGGGRNYQQNSDGGSYNRNLNSNSGGNNYRSQRYENSNGNGNGQQRQYGNQSSNAGYNNHHSNHYNNNQYNNSSSNYGNRSNNAGDGNVNARNYQRGDDYGNNYRDYEESPRQQRYNNHSNTNSLERAPNSGRYNKPDLGNSKTQGNGYRRNEEGAIGGGYNERNDRSERSYNNRSPIARDINVTGAPPSGLSGITGARINYQSTPASAVNSKASSTSSSRGISPNSGSNSYHQSAATPPPGAGRWVPPSLRPQHGLTQSEKNDAVFRKVRGILNKLTPEKFQDLSDDLLKLDLNSNAILNGVILLIFDKALDEPKYSSMYAQLCKRLSEEAPSFETDPSRTCTFLHLLIAVCRDKFNNRLKRDDIEITKRPLQPTNSGENDSDEEERRHLAKQRMLGNVKFIGELNKLDMLSKSVLHQCITELLDKKKKRTALPQEMCEDMECLAQLLKTCGKNLDSGQDKELMNQYFETLERRSKSTDYPPRIRFMLKDVIELRENNWVPRKVGTTEGPVPIKQIRTDDDTLIRTPFAQRGRDMRNNDNDSDSWMNRFHLNLQPSGFSDMFSSLSVTGASPIVSPFSGGNNRSYNNNRDRNQQGGYNPNRYNKQNNGAGNNRDDMRGNQNRDQNSMQYGSAGNNQLGGKELAPRFKRSLITTNQDSVENLQMRPAANSLLFRATIQNQKMPTTLPISTPPTGSAAASNGGQNKDQLSNAQYPMLGTPTTHLNNSARPSSTPSAEYDGKLQRATGGGVIGASSTSTVTLERGLKSTSSTPNFELTTVNASNMEKSSSNEKLDSNKTQINGSAINDKKSNTSSVQLVTKHGSIEKNSGNTGNNGKQQTKDKAFSKEEMIKRTAAYFKEKFYYVEELAEQTNPEISDNGENGGTGQATQLDELLDGFIELKVPEKCLKDVCINHFMDVLEKADEKYLVRAIDFLQGLRKRVNIKPNIILEMFKQVVNKMNEREALNPRITTHVAFLLAKAVGEANLLKLSDVANYTDHGQHYPLFLLVLQQLHKMIGKDALEEKFRASKVDLMNSLPEVDRNKTRLAEILDDRNLAFLYPLLKVQSEMWKQLLADATPAEFYKWIKTNINAKYYKDPGFISALMNVVLQYVTGESTLAEGVDTKVLPDKAINEKEENLLQKYCHILITFLEGKIDLQLIALYALQVFCFNAEFPKGMLCRWFNYLYKNDVIEEDAFLKWKEEITDKYPGKGSALFQVNTWLTMLQEAESEEDDE